MPGLLGHRRRHLNAFGAAPAVLGDARMAERLEDRTLLSAVTDSGAAQPEQSLEVPADNVESSSDETQLQIQNCLADWLAGVDADKDTAEVQIAFGDGRVATFVLSPVTVDGQVTWQATLKDVGRSESSDGISLVVDEPSTEFDLAQLTLPNTSAQTSELVNSNAPISQTPGFSTDGKFAATSNSGERLADEPVNPFTLPLVKLDQQTESETDEPTIFMSFSADDVSDVSTEEATVDCTSIQENVELNDLGFAPQKSLSSNADEMPVFEVSLETWVVDEPVSLGIAATAIIPMANVEAEILLANLDPAELSGSLAAPFEPVLGLASTVVLMVQTVGRTALLAFVGEGGVSGGPVAEFVEPLLDLADVGQPSERWELKTVDAVIDAPLAQAVSGNRHFEIRNIGPATDADGNASRITSLTLLTLPRHGALEQVGVGPTTFRYVPDPGFSGVDVFRFRMRSSDGATHEGQVVINVPAESARTGLRTVNRPIELQLGNELHSSTVAAFEVFEDWHHELDGSR